MTFCTEVPPAASTANWTCTVPLTPDMRASGGATGRRPFVRSGTPVPSATSRTAETPGSVRAGTGEAVAAPGTPPGITSTGGGVGPVDGAAGLVEGGEVAEVVGGVAGDVGFARGASGRVGAAAGGFAGGVVAGRGVGVGAGIGAGVAAGVAAGAAGAGVGGGVGGAAAGVGGARGAGVGVATGSGVAGAAVRKPDKRRSILCGGPGMNCARTWKPIAGPPGSAANRHVRSACSSASDHGESPSRMAASPTEPSLSSVTSATTVAGPFPPLGNGGIAPCLISGMPASRVMSGSLSANVIGTVRRTGTGLPSTLVTSYSHWRAAVSAAWSKGGTLRSTSADATLPVVSMSSSRMTIPRWPIACASGGNTGCTKFLRLGAGTSRPATLTSEAAAAGAGDGSCDATARGGTAAADRAIRTATFSCRWPGTSS